MEYTVIQADSLESIINKINQYIAIGWRPIGGVSVIRYQGTVYPTGFDGSSSGSMWSSKDYDYLIFSQALIKP